MTAKKTVQELISNPTMSEKALSGVTFSSDDRQFLKREFDGVLGYMKSDVSSKITETQRFLAEILIDTHKTFNQKMDTLMEAMLEIKRDVKEIRIEMKELKLDIKSINLDLLVIHKELLAHDKRIKDVENKLKNNERQLVKKTT
jgi:septal ring factor EnvC (AmiA/AmiB activator)